MGTLLWQSLPLSRGSYPWSHQLSCPRVAPRVSTRLQSQPSCTLRLLLPQATSLPQHLCAPGPAQSWASIGSAYRWDHLSRSCWRSRHSRGKEQKEGLWQALSWPENLLKQMLQGLPWWQQGIGRLGMPPPGSSVGVCPCPVAAALGSGPGVM